ncbi:MAG TPA: YIP1 family protein [Candidatus Elarobacter sp.]|nr:YIP1 family protein [Candidatus Elarobacter sp.]
MSTSETAIGPRPGLTNAVDIVVAPNAAFDRLRQVPTWGWAFLIATVLGIIGSVLLEPAMMHAMQTSMPAKLAASPTIASLPPDKQQQQIAMMMSFSKVWLQISFIFVPIYILIAALLQALVMTVANAMGGGDGSFKKYFALSVNVAIVGAGLTYLVLGIIAMVRGASSFETTTAVQASLPSLALLAPGAKGALAGFLGSFSVFAIWSIVLLALGMQRVGRISPPVAWAASIFMLLCTAGLAAWGGAQNG